MRRLWFMAPMLVAGLFWCSFLMGDDKKPAKEPIYITKQLPANYSKLGLSQKQKNDIYKIRGKFRAEIQELSEKIKELRDKEKVDCERVLTAAQKARLREILVGPSGNKGEDDEDIPAKAGKKKDTNAKDKKKPVEIKK